MTGVAPRRRVVRAGLLLLVATTIGCDQFSKRIVTACLAGVPGHSFLGDTVRIGYALNRGAFLSLGDGWPPWARTALFTVGTGLVLAACTVLVLRASWPSLCLTGLAFLIGGGVSNLADRVRQGAVVDFLNVGVGPLRTGIFNVADMAILLGVGLLLVGRPRTGLRLPGTPDASRGSRPESR